MIIANCYLTNYDTASKILDVCFKLLKSDPVSSMQLLNIPDLSHHVTEIHTYHIQTSSLISSPQYIV